MGRLKQHAGRIQEIRHMKEIMKRFATGLTTLGIHGIAFQRMAFGQHQHTPRSAELDRRAKTRDAAADHEKVCFNLGGRTAG
jgi:hypothetical protein